MASKVIEPGFRHQPDAAEVLETLACAVLIEDDDGVVRVANERARTILGCDDRPNTPMQVLLGTAGASRSLRISPQGALIWSTQVQMHDGRLLFLTSRALPSGGRSVAIGDVGALLSDGKIARTDKITGLHDRATARQRLSELLGHHPDVTVFLVALDRFKHVNDTVGHQIGDTLLRMVGERLAGLVREDDLLARFGGDEFAIVVPRLMVPHAAQAFAEMAIELVARSYIVAGNILKVGASVGIAQSNGIGDASADQLFMHADLALASAKSDRGVARLFEANMDARMQVRRALELDLIRALSLAEFELLYQPQYSTRGHELVGFEALIRWDSPTRGRVSPADFIPIAEETGLIEALGGWVLRTACRAAAAWSRPVNVAVNLSPLQLRKPGLLAVVTSALAAAGLPPDRLELEITEGALLEDTEEVLMTLTSLRQLGVRVSMDDFGTGYSSLSYLQKFPFDKLKIDQSFVRDMERNEEAGAIVRTIARLGLSLGMTITAEGVESEAQLAAVTAEGCTEVQGYLTGRPMSEADAAALVSRHDGGTGVAAPA